VIPLREAGRVRAEEIGEPQAPHQHDRAQHAAPLPAAARCGHARVQAQRPRHALEPARKRDVLHQGDVGISADRIEGFARDEHRLIAGHDAGEARADVHRGGDKRQQRMKAFDPHIEAAPGAPAPCKAVEHAPVGIGRQARIGMEKQQDIAARHGRAGIHLRGAPTRGCDDAIRPRLRKRHGAVGAAAVGHDDLGASRAQRRKGLQRRDDACRLVEHRNNDGKRGHQERARQAACSTA
jgi:hypothetical protein